MIRTAAKRTSMAHFALCFAIALALALPPGTPLPANPATESASVNDEGLVTFTQPSITEPTDGSFAATLTVTIDRPTTYLESRVQIRRPGGALLYQKTEVRNNLESGTEELGYARELADLDLTPGRYPVEIRVRTDSGTVREWVLESRLLLYDPAADPLRVVPVARINGSPGFDPTGMFVVDPATDSRSRSDTERLAELILDDQGMRFTLAIPPILLEEWQRVAAGTEVLREDSVVELPADDPVARSYASTLELLREAHATGRIEMLHVPYAAPDIGALQQEGRLLDLSDHYRRSVSGYLASLEATPVPGTAVLGDVLPHGVLGLLADRGLRFAVVAPTGAVSAEETPAAGVYRAGGMSVLVADPDVSSEIETGDIEAMLDALFEHVLSEENTAPVALTVDLGAGRPTKINDFLDALELMRATPWIALTDATSAAEHEPAPFVTLPAEVMPMPGARAGYWDAISEARRQATALARAAGDDNSIARSTNDASLIAQSRLWAGSDGRWAAADRARAFADFATLGAASVLDTVDLSAPPDLTLSSASGTVPVSIVNGSGTELELTVRTRADGMSVGWTEQVLRFRPQENPVMVPVDLQSSISGQLHVEVWAGEVMLAQRNTTVRASYLDRLATVGAVALVLIAILLFVRRRIRAGAGAGTITTNNDSADRR